MNPRLIIPGVVLQGTVPLSEEDRRHIVQVLRMREGDRLILCDGNGLEALCSLTAGREATVLETYPSQGEDTFSIHLYPSLSKGERFEWMLQKAAELGAVSITPVLSSRCIAASPSEEKIKRYRKILHSAAEQSGRGKLPLLRNPLLFRDAVLVKHHLPLFCYEEESTVTLKAGLTESVDIAIMTGPEGGYAPEEAERAGQCGWKAVSLGNTILRCETAPLMALSAIRYHHMSSCEK
ncbi:MAG: 16S rRNA (uracil(1498)-N(3))-methyltransferase [Oscillospiraceae bacterium]|nr:16S rRNA (uracil(1498)-N(3))-methyltransferase [Oscillospiraceae bacterium]